MEQTQLAADIGLHDTGYFLYVAVWSKDYRSYFRELPHAEFYSQSPAAVQLKKYHP
jgi:hypothetical protein